jgi:hypothetical protein
MEVHPLYKDPSYVRSTHFKITSSQVKSLYKHETHKVDYVLEKSEFKIPSFITSNLYFISSKNDSDVNKVEGQSPCPLHMIGNRLVHICSSSAHSREALSLLINQFCIVCWPGDHIYYCIMFTMHFMNLLIPP